MNYEKALSFYKNDKTLQLFRAEHFPLLIAFFHLAFKQQDRISYLQSELQSLLGDYIYALQRQGINDYGKSAIDYLHKWAEQGYLRRYYERADEPVYELSPATESALKWLEDLNKQQFVGTHSRLIQFFHLLQQIANTTANPDERIQQLQEERHKIDQEIEQIRQGNFSRPSSTQVKENYFLAEETARRLLSDFRQVEENFRALDTQTRQKIIKSADGRGIKLTYLEADLSDNSSRFIKDLDQDSIAYKIDIKPETPFYDWLESYIQRSFGNFICTDVTGLQHMPFGITRQGLIKSGRIRHTKDDRRRIDDRRNYVLGWSNTEKIKALEASVDKLEKKINELRSQLKRTEEEEQKNKEQKQRLSLLLYVRDFSRINWQHHVGKIYELEQERNELLNNNNVLAQLQRNKSDVDQQISETKTKEKQATEKIGGLKTTIKSYQDQRQGSYQQKEQLAVHLKEKWYPLIEHKLHDIKITLRGIDNRQEEFRKQFQGENGELRKLRGRQVGYRSSIEKKMREIKEHSRAEYSELTDSIDARAEYIKKFEQLVSEDLKRHEARFKEELNKNVITVLRYLTVSYRNMKRISNRRYVPLTNTFPKSCIMRRRILISPF